MKNSVLVTVTRAILILFIVLQGLVVISHFLNLPDIGPFIWPGQFVMTAEGHLSEPPVVDIDLTWAHDSERGTYDARTGLPPVELGGPFTARVVIWSPTLLEQVAYDAGQLGLPLIGIAVSWLLLRIVSSVGKGSPFTEVNARRLGWIALLVGVGGTVVSVYTAWLNNWLILRSAAAPAFASSGFVSFIPAIVGLVLGALAVAWRRGVEFQHDSDGLV